MWWRDYGPSPRVRGSPRDARAALGDLGSIPACAGKPCAAAGSRPAPGVHPRVCGEAISATARIAVQEGPSPRVRGSRRRRHRQRPDAGSIPACAGKPWVWQPFPGRSGVHPRVCGEAILEFKPDESLEGPSPRVRGSHVGVHRHEHAFGSIPACAGKPASGSAYMALRGVHPRVCGEAAHLQSRVYSGLGPSPRVRGSLPGRLQIVGELGVHPRVCGEAVDIRHGDEVAKGPSPRVRGSRVRQSEPAARDGSIPACAGKPRRLAARGPTGGVHPRVCGEAARNPEWIGPCSGPSPRVRGSRAGGREDQGRRGSIPACAGKPSAEADSGVDAGVHPRVCGEARMRAASPSYTPGPSPRVRGSRRRSVVQGARAGSIPACAGKPV